MNKLAKAEATAITTLREEWDKANSKSPLKFPHQYLGNKYQEWLSEFDKEEAEQAVLQMNAIRQGGFAVLPRKCTGLSECPHAHVCPFARHVPVGFQCPMEMAVIKDKMHDYMEEFQIAGFNASQFTVLNRLVELDILDLRMSSMLAASESNILVEEVKGISMTGEQYYQKLINPLLDAKEKINREKYKLLNLLVATPEAKYKKAAALKESTQDEYTQKIQSISKKLGDIERKLITDAQ